MNQDHHEGPYGIAGLAAVLTTPQPDGNAQGLVSKPITIRVDAGSLLILEAASDHLKLPPATLLRRISEAGLEQFRDELSARGVDLDLRHKPEHVSVTGDTIRIGEKCDVENPA